MKNKVLLKFTVIMLMSISLNAQTLSPFVVSSSGGFYTSANAMLSFTVAEMTMVESFIKPNSMLTQGFQQPEQNPSAIVEVNNFQQISAFPNPSQGVFNLNFNSDVNTDFSLKIYNMLGEIIYSSEFQASKGINTNRIDISQNRQGVYFLAITELNPFNNNKTSVIKINLVY